MDGFEITPLDPREPLPTLVRPVAPGVDLGSALATRRHDFDELLHDSGGLLFRGFALGGVEGFQAVLDAYTQDLLEYTYRSTPRHSVGRGVYTSTEYPPDETIPHHNEMAYTESWPMKIWFFCAIPAERGGETPIVDSRRVYRRIPPEVRRRFVERGGVMYVRNYGLGIDLPWEEVFQTRERAVVEEYCRQHGIQWEWIGASQLRTRQVCQAVANHPVTGEPVWFNQAHLFHVSNMAPEMREILEASFGVEGLPRNAFYGDGTPLEDEVLADIRAAYDELEVVFPWQAGDLLLLDNMLTAHGRRPFTGERKVVVGMSQPLAA